MLGQSFPFSKNVTRRTLVIIRGRLESVSINRPRARGEPNVIRTAARVASFFSSRSHASNKELHTYLHIRRSASNATILTCSSRKSHISVGTRIKSTY